MRDQDCHAIPFWLDTMTSVLAEAEIARQNGSELGRRIANDLADAVVKLARHLTESELASGLRITDGSTTLVGATLAVERARRKTSAEPGEPPSTRLQ